MASALGINTRRIDSLSFAFSTGLAGIAGSILAYLYTTKYKMGDDFIVESFMVVILGGTGQLIGTVFGGALIGTSNSMVTKVLNNEPIARVVVLLLVIAFIQFRPSGMFAPRERVYD